MRPLRRFSAPLALSLACTLAFVSPLSHAAADDDPAAAQQQVSALERGYRTGYSDGYQSGYRDSIQNATRDYRGKEDYERADRAYVAAYGAREDYRDGYQQGYEIGYETGYERRGFDSAVPAGLTRRGAAGGSRAADARDARDDSAAGGVSDSDERRGSNTGQSNTDAGARRDSPDRDDAAAANNDALRGTVEIPVDTTLRVELLNTLSTDASQRGDRFEARVVEPAAYAGATVAGRVTNVRRSGKIRGTAELQLAFEQVRTPDGRSANLHAQVIEVVNRDASRVGDVDEEGGVKGQSTTKDDAAKIGAGAGIGAIIGAIAGGGAGAAIGAAIGAGVGVGGAITSRGRDIRLERGQELLIRTSTDARIR